MTWRIALQLALSGLSVGSIYAIVALSLAIPFKASRVLNFAQGELVTLGAYIALVLSSYGLPYPVTVPATLVIAAIFGILIERLFIRPIVGAPEFTLVIATFAIGLIIRALIRIHWQDNVFFLPAPYAGPALAVGPLRVNPSYLVIIASTAALVTLLILFFQRTRLGKAMRAVAFNQTAARLMGISVGRVFGSAWALSAAIGAVAGLLLAPVAGINPELGHLIVKALVAAVIGGFGSLGGAVFGGLLLGVLETYAGALFGAALKEIIPFAILIAFLLVRPQGLWGATQVRV
ncbi:MAG: branched-chain amino acid ABC transporter permease [Xanthobacteraceae bacterium]